MGLQDRLRGARQEKIDTEKRAGESFLNENKNKEGVQELENGIQYKVVQEGTGEKPSGTATITAHYRGALITGKEFDNSFKRNQPFTARLTQLIKGWQEVIPMMPEGSRWELWIPSDLGYGDNGVPQSGIPGGAVLHFEIELLRIH